MNVTNLIEYDFIIQPGWQNSGPEHWQSHWQKLLNARRVEHTDDALWDSPEIEAWVDALHAQISLCTRPVVIIAHSLGCATTMHLAQRYPEKIHAALLVAPADVERANAPKELHSFAPLPQTNSRIKTHIVASTDDPFCSAERAQQFADWWQASLTYLPNAGHINSTSGHIEWEEGLHELKKLLA